MHNLNKCNKIITTNNKWMYINMNPRAPQIHGTIKLHKQDRPIRPIVNWREKPRIQNKKTPKHNTKQNTDTAKFI
jgi:hypothetical protein